MHGCDVIGLDLWEMFEFTFTHGFGPESAVPASCFFPGPSFLVHHHSVRAADCRLATVGPLFLAAIDNLLRSRLEIVDIRLVNDHIKRTGQRIARCG